MKSSEESLTQLIERAKKGDPKDLEELYYRFKPLILKMAKTVDQQYHEDAKQELIIELYEAVRRFEPRTGRKKEEDCSNN